MPELVDDPVRDRVTSRSTTGVRNTAQLRDDPVFLRRPRLSDAGHMWRIAKDTGVLDVNSSYAYLLWCRDFAATSVVAEIGTTVAGFATGFIRPESPDTLFVWQVAVDSAARGRGVGVSMLDHMLCRATPFAVRFLETTITADNPASLAMFTALANSRGTDIYARPLFSESHFPDGHAAEDLYTVGPIHQNGTR
ncbi:diaminobutyrate acetyltransferase [Rhodococcus gannanensis]|uniref:L-2,4-diaminobutyric acid acetyltransferase n=1 Tax=Rhodococcus gannanensis TaxID=1960308 RepID=A0ABW4P270_9NOCA